jgi:hypothetical protein
MTHRCGPHRDLGEQGPPSQHSGLQDYNQLASEILVKTLAEIARTGKQKKSRINVLQMVRGLTLLVLSMSFIID